MSPAAAPAVRSGLDVLLQDRLRDYRGARAGLIANSATVDASLRGAVRLLAASKEIRLSALFGPEHGLLGGAQDMIPVRGESDAATGLRVYSLYGDTFESLSPPPGSLAEIDILIADLQDVGARYYTFAATIAYALNAAAAAGRTLIVLDRPNPIGGAQVEGPGLDPRMESFVGAFDVPIRHGLTLGELLARHARLRGLSASLEVVKMEGWRRGMSFEETGLPWVPPSPNMPTLDTAYVYPGGCLIEATNLSEGRGTTRPFEWTGAPFLDADALAERLAREELPGVIFRPHTFIPAFHKWAGQPCGGVALHVTDRAAFQPVRTGLALLIACRALGQGRFAWRSEPYEFVSDRPAIDLLMGHASVREAIEAGASAAEIASAWPAGEARWLRDRTPDLLYK